MTIDSREAMRILRERIAAEKEKNTYTPGEKRKSTGDNARYPFHLLKLDQTATLRFYPDHANSNNPFFWRKREVIRLPFMGVVGGEYPTEKDVTVEIPCVDMFKDEGMSCPIIAETRPWWKDEAKIPMARIYYKQVTWIYQGEVVNSPIVEETAPENPIRRFIVKKTIHNKIFSSLDDPDIEDIVTDYHNGLDFHIKVTKGGANGKGGFYNDYGTSAFARRSRPLSENSMIAINQYGLWNLKDSLGRIPDADEMLAIKAMFKDSLAGKPFDATSYGHYYRAYVGRGDNEDGDTNSQVERNIEEVTTRKETVAPKETVQAETRPSASATSSGSKPDAKDVLTRLRERNASKA